MRDKRCPRCETTKPVSDFYRNAARKDGVGVYCISCQCEVDDAREARHRANLLSMLGGSCASCGYGDPRALQVDHRNGGGGALRKAGLFAYPAGLIRQVTAAPADFQLLCANCNIIKKMVVGEHVGARVYKRHTMHVRVLQRGAETDKWCSKCERRQPVSAFHANRSRSDGLSGWCRTCQTAATQQGEIRDRAALYDLLGGRCNRCQFSNPLALQVDHVNSDGQQDRQRIGKHPRRLLAAARAEPDRYQLLCANCNCIKRIELGEHKGQRQYARVVLQERTLKGRAEAGRKKTELADVRQAELIRVIEQRRSAEMSPQRLPQGSWSRHYHRCLGCLGTDRRHAAEGICVRCYTKVRGYTRRVPRTVAARSS